MSNLIHTSHVYHQVVPPLVSLQTHRNWHGVDITLLFTPVYIWSRDSIVGIATGYGLDEQGVAVQAPVGSRIFSTPRCPDRLWGPPNLLYNG
jgi:hypothetical protein